MGGSGMIRAHVIENGKVANTIIVNDLDFLPNLVDASLGGEIGDVWNGEAFSKPPKWATIEEAKAGRLAELAEYRWLKETAGVNVNGFIIKTDEVSQAKMSGAKVYSDLNPETLIDWKTDNGWIQIDRNTLLTAGNAVGAHVQACYSQERVHSDAINALDTIAEIEAYDIQTGW